jgi:hypothetical protein
MIYFDNTGNVKSAMLSPKLSGRRIQLLFKEAPFYAPLRNVNAVAELFLDGGRLEWFIPLLLRCLAILMVREGTKSANWGTF